MIRDSSPNAPNVTYAALVLAAAGLSIGGAAGTALGQCETGKLLPGDAGALDLFGHAVAMSGDRIIVGVPVDDDNGPESGSAYIFRFDGTQWIEEIKLLASDGAAVDKFGCSVSIDGDLAVCGAMWDDDNGDQSGSLYVYRYDGATWVEETKLIATDGAAGDQLGYSTSLSGNAIISGADNDADLGANAGAAFVFRYDGNAWHEDAKLLASDGSAGDDFGFAVAISGTAALVGARNQNEQGGDAGAAYVFRYDGASWSEEAKLVASDGGLSDQLGTSVAISGNVAVAGAPWENTGAFQSGAAYVYRFDGAAWNEEQKLFASDPQSSDQLGASVSIDGDTALIGAWHDDDGGSNAGAAYVFRFDGAAWVESLKLLAADGTAGDEFGSSVCLRGDDAVVGARLDDELVLGGGSAYAFTGLAGIDCNDNGVADACDIRGATSDDEDGNGVPDECETCPADVDGSGDVGFSDLIAVLSTWGPCGACAEDLDGSGDVGFGDLIQVLSNWGPC